MVSLKSLPVCSCGYVFKELSCYFKWEEIDEKTARQFRVFEPPCCPACKEQITSIELIKEGWGGNIRVKEENF